jgi:uncharacterized protein (DUF2147 family)
MTVAVRSVLVLSGVLLAEPAWSAEPWGEWLVAEKTAQIRLIDCNGALWGVVAWEKDPGRDAKNPNPAKRSRPTLGMPILLGMRASGRERWDGTIYNSENGKTYSGGVRMIDDSRLRITGCILGFLCGGETWTRTVPAASGGLQEPDSATCARIVLP